MRCPKCGGATRVTTTQARPDCTYRWVRCSQCGFAFRTCERVFLGDLRQRGSAASTSVLTEDDVIAMREAHARGVSQRELSRTYGICQSHVSDIIHRAAWTHV